MAKYIVSKEGTKVYSENDFMPMWIEEGKICIGQAKSHGYAPMLCSGPTETMKELFVDILIFLADKDRTMYFISDFFKDKK